MRFVAATAAAAAAAHVSSFQDLANCNHRNTLSDGRLMVNL